MAVSVLYQGNVENKGMTEWTKDGQRCGTVGESLRIEGIYIKLETDEDLGIEAQAHVQDFGWMDPVGAGELCGTIDQSKRLEAIKIKLTGSAADKYSIIYGVHVENVGDMQTAMDGEPAGTEGFSERIEAIQIWIVEKGVDFKIETLDSFRKVEPVPEPVAPAVTETVSGYFGPDEFKCECGCGGDVCQEIKDLANRVRELYGYPLVISSGFRCYDQNERDGGIPGSNHTIGQGADMYSPGRMSYDEVDRLAECIRACGGGVIKYHEQLFCHMELSDADWSMN